MSGRNYDLHTHSASSDGMLRPRDLVALAAAGLGGLALTDHDTTSGLEEALAAGEARGLPVIPGIEFTTDFGAGEAHILGYFIDHGHPRLVKRLDHVLRGRVDRARRMLEKLAALGYSLSWEALRTQAPGDYIGRAHIMRALLAEGLVPPDEADSFFRLYLAFGRPAYVPHEELTTAEAIDLTLAAGGVPVLAHPGRTGADEIVPGLVELGLGGIEVYYPSHNTEDIVHFLLLAARYDLIPTGGSDFHGAPGGPTLGRAAAGREAVARLAAKSTGSSGRAFLASPHILEWKGP